MKANTFTLDVDIKQENYINEPVIKQNDSVVFIINLTDNGAPVDLMNVTRYTIATERGDGVSIIADGRESGPSQVTFNLPRESTTRTGRATHTVQLYSADERVSSFTFPMTVDKDPSASLIVTGGDKTLIEIVLGEGPAVIQAAKDATTAATAATAELITQADYAKQQGDYAQTEGAKATTAAENADLATGRANAATTEADAAKGRANASADAAELTASKADTAATGAEAAAGRADTAADAADTAATGLEAIKTAATEAASDATAAADAARAETSGLADLKTAVTAATASAEGASTQATAQATYAQEQGDYAKRQGDAVQEIFDSGLVASVNGQTGAVVLTSGDITDSPVKRFASDAQIADWDAKETPQGAQEKVDALAGTKSQPDGLAALGPDGKVLAEQLPRIANTASDVTIADVGDYFTGTTAEEALQEAGAGIQDALNRAEQAFTSASNGKTAVADAVTAKGVAASPADAFALLAEKIGQIPSGKKFASGNTQSVFYPSITRIGGSTTNSYGIKVTGLGFEPSVILSWGSVSTDESVSIYRKNPGVFRRERTTLVGRVQTNGISGSAGAYLNDVGDFTVTAASFTIPVGAGGNVYDWIAYE